MPNNKDQITADRQNKTDLSKESTVQKNEEHSATNPKQQNSELSDEDIDDILSTILSREKEYQTKKQQYGKFIPLQSGIKDW